MYIGDHGIGHFNHSGGTLGVTGNLVIGNWFNNNGGFDAEGYYEQTGGQAYVGGDMIMGWDSGTVSKYTLNDPVGNSGAPSMQVVGSLLMGLEYGPNESATVEITKGFMKVGGFIAVGRNYNGTYNQTGGDLEVVGDF